MNERDQVALQISEASRRATVVTKVSIGFLCLVIAFSLAASGYALYDRFQETHERRELQARVNAGFANSDKAQRLAILQNCREIEELKAGFREEAQRSFADLERNARVLGINLTAEARFIALQNLERKLAKYEAVPCPRPIQKKG